MSVWFFVECALTQLMTNSQHVILHCAIDSNLKLLFFAKDPFAVFFSLCRLVDRTEVYSRCSSRPCWQITTLTRLNAIRWKLVPTHAGWPRSKSTLSLSLSLSLSGTQTQRWGKKVLDMLTVGRWNRFLSFHVSPAGVYTSKEIPVSTGDSWFQVRIDCHWQFVSQRHCRHRIGRGFFCGRLCAQVEKKSILTSNARLPSLPARPTSDCWPMLFWNPMIERFFTSNIALIHLPLSFGSSLFLLLLPFCHSARPHTERKSNPSINWFIPSICFFKAHSKPTLSNST